MTAKAVIGADPGSHGAIVYLEKGDDPATLVFAMSKWTTRGLLSAMNYDYWHVSAFLEEVHSMPTDGKATAFQFGKNVGWMLCALESYTKSVELVQPKIWQYEFNLGGKHGPPGCARHQEQAARKRAHKAKAQELFPDLRVTLDICDALLIAEYGWRKTYGELTNGKTQNTSRKGKGLTGREERVHKVRDQERHRDEFWI